MAFIYLDNNASTPLLPAVAEAMAPFLDGVYGNAASAHSAGRQARRALESARECVAHILGADADEVVFTSGATEANNLALFGLTQGAPWGHILTSPVEHPSVTEPLAYLAKRGWSIEHLPVGTTGLVCTEGFSLRIRPETRLVAVMLANHETGAVQPVAELARHLEGRTPFHCDAVQAVGKISVNFHALGVSTLAVSAHKFHGPKGVGALLVRRGVKLEPMLYGGHQQQARRPGTEPVGLAVGMARALELWHSKAAARTQDVRRLRERFFDALRQMAAPVILNGPEDGIPHTLNLSFPGCQADSLLMNLDLAQVCCSTGSACSSGSLLPSPVLQAMRVPAENLHSAMRFSLCPLLTEADIDEAARRIAAVVNRLRQLPVD
ncbi:MAG TPA: cysteine desulfurase family protein [Gemmataceae bacterium]|nr:cysteine desulfurase family protein [Gemmataceae bacterium]